MKFMSQNHISCCSSQSNLFASLALANNFTQAPTKLCSPSSALRNGPVNENRALPTTLSSSSQLKTTLSNSSVSECDKKSKATTHGTCCTVHVCINHIDLNTPLNLSKHNSAAAESIYSLRRGQATMQNETVFLQAIGLGDTLR
jgi:hypothetical protein